MKVTLFFTFASLHFFLTSCCCSPHKHIDISMKLLNKTEHLALFGHRNPDLDSYASSYAYGELLRLFGFDAHSFALGEPNQETQFVLKELGLAPLPILKSLAPGQKAILLDHSEKAQTLPGLSRDDIVQIIDHHKVSFHTRKATSVQTEPIGATATLIFRKYQEHGIKPSHKSATLLLAAILSDTRILTSPTTTEVDRLACEILSSQLGKNHRVFGKAILSAGTKTGHLSVEKIYHMDRKTYSFGSKNASIGVVQTTDIADTLKRGPEFLSYMKDYCVQEGFSFCALLITNSLEKETFALLVGDESLFEKAFGDKKKKGGYFLENVVSRKRQVVPELEKHL